jgi:hypothetical protein
MALVLRRASLAPSPGAQYVCAGVGVRLLARKRERAPARKIGPFNLPVTPPLRGNDSSELSGDQSSAGATHVLLSISMAPGLRSLASSACTAGSASRFA